MENHVAMHSRNIGPIYRAMLEKGAREGKGTWRGPQLSGEASHKQGSLDGNVAVRRGPLDGSVMLFLLACFPSGCDIGVEARRS